MDATPPRLARPPPGAARGGLGWALGIVVLALYVLVSSSSADRTMEHRISPPRPTMAASSGRLVVRSPSPSPLASPWSLSTTCFCEATGFNGKTADRRPCGRA